MTTSETCDKYAKYHEMGLSAIQPEGWLRRYLEVQHDGLTGNMEAAGYPFNTNGWAGKRVTKRCGGIWWPYEQTAYWVDGAIRCGYLLGDKALINKAKKQVDYVLRHADDDGYLGPEFLKEPIMEGRWPHAVFFRAMMAHYSATGDKRVPAALVKHYLTNTNPHTGLKDPSEVALTGLNGSRDVVNVEAMLWAYQKTGDKRMLDMAVKSYEGYNERYSSDDTALETMLSDKKITVHGVTFNEQAKLGAILYSYTGERKYLDATLNAYNKVDRDAMLIDGIHSSTEGLRRNTPLDSHETCDIADFTWSNGYILMSTGAAHYADKIEKAVFNAAPGAVRYDFRALQYFSCPNQVICDNTSDHNEVDLGGPAMCYKPNQGPECCPGEVNRIMPNYAARMWMNDDNNGLAAALYGPSSITSNVGEAGKKVTIVEETQYPFSERIDFEIRCKESVQFPFTLRIPGWCDNPKVMLNGRELDIKTRPGEFFIIDREFNHNDRITLLLPMKLKLVRWPGGGIAIERGPIVYSLRIEEDWRHNDKDRRQTPEFPAYNLYAASPWNYALAVDEANLEEAVKVIHHPFSLEPWSLGKAPIELQVPARKVSGWKTARIKKNRNASLTPPLPDPATLKQRLSKRVETVTLVPYGCTHLRITIFPQAE